MEPEQVNAVYRRVWKSKEWCRDCEHYKTWLESEPWGSTEATRELSECDVSDVNECPGVAYYLDQ